MNKKEMAAIVKEFEKKFKNSNDPEELKTLLNLCLAFMNDKGYAFEFGAYLAGFAAKLTALQQEQIIKKRY